MSLQVKDGGCHLRGSRRNGKHRLEDLPHAQALRLPAALNCKGGHDSRLIAPRRDFGGLAGIELGVPI